MNIYQKAYLKLIFEENLIEFYNLRNNIITLLQQFCNNNNIFGNLQIIYDPIQKNLKNMLYIKIITDQLINRVKILQNIQKFIQNILNNIYIYIQYTSLSSIGNINIPAAKIKIVIKPSKNFNMSHAGKINQEVCNNIINDLLKNQANTIIFRDKNNNQFKCENIINSILVGNKIKDINKNPLKADIHLISSNNNIYKISLKKSNAEFYGLITQVKNSLAYEKYKLILKKCLENNINKQYELPYIIKHSQNYIISNDVYWEQINNEIKKQILFGSDINENNGCIIYNNFQLLTINDILIENNTYIIPVDEIIFNNNNLPRMYWIIMNKSNRAGELRGIWCRACNEKRIKNRFNAKNLNLK